MLIHREAINCIVRNLIKPGIRRYSDLVLVKKNGPVTLIGFNRPEKDNCLTVDMVMRLSDEVFKFEGDSESKCAVLYGERGNFSSGLDPDDLKVDPYFIEKIEQIELFKSHCKKPVVAAVSGFANDYAFDVSLWCDMMVVDETAVLANYSRLSDYSICDQQVERLHSILGFKKTLDLLLTGRMVKAKEAFECGIASRIVACGASLGQAFSLAVSLSRVRQEKLNGIRQSIYNIRNNRSSKKVQDVTRKTEPA